MGLDTYQLPEDGVVQVRVVEEGRDGGYGYVTGPREVVWTSFGKRSVEGKWWIAGLERSMETSVGVEVL